MTTRHITTSHEHDVCDICGRTLLRGESTEVFLDGSRRYAVCELCKPQALHEGWVREGTIPEFQGSNGSSRQRRSLLGRLRGLGGPANGGGSSDESGVRGPQTLDDELSVAAWPPVATPAARIDRDALEPELGDAGVRSDPRTRGRRSRAAQARPATRSTRARSRDRNGDEPLTQTGEPRHVHAVPTSGDHKIAAAAEAFNRSEHTRTVSGVARSLGAAGINLSPDPARPTVVWLVISWELCWYRYEIELSDDPGSVRLDAQGYELSELAEHELAPNAVADEAGRIAV